MSLMIKRFIAISVFALLAACGGGGSEESPSKTELEGTWIYSGYSRTDFSKCRTDLPGKDVSFKIVFSLNKYQLYERTCLTVPTLDPKTGSLNSGFIGSFIEFPAPDIEGKFSIGGIYVHSNDPRYQMRAIDLISSTTTYSSYNLTGDDLTFATPYLERDGSTPSLRMTNTASTKDDQVLQFVRQK
jgi:hypothetical protein